MHSAPDSSAALQGYPYVSAYSASKHALLGWSRSAALECAPKGVAISTVCPHYVDTPLTDRSIETMREKTGRSEEDLRAFVASQNPSGVIVRPEQVAEVTADLLGSDRSGVVIELTGTAPITLDEGVACTLGGVLMLERIFRRVRGLRDREREKEGEERQRLRRWAVRPDGWRPQGYEHPRRGGGHALRRGNRLGRGPEPRG